MLQISSLTSFSKHLLTIGVRAMGRQSFKHVTFLFFGTGTMTDVFKQEGTIPVEGERLNMSVNTPASCIVHALITRPGMPSAPAAFRMSVRLNTLCTSASAMTGRVCGGQSTLRSEI